MVVHPPPVDPAVEVRVLVGALAAKVVHAVPPGVVGVKEGRHLADGVAVPRHNAGATKEDEKCSVRKRVS